MQLSVYICIFSIKLEITTTSWREIKNVYMAGITFKNYMPWYDFFGFKVFLCNYSFTNARIQ